MFENVAKNNKQTAGVPPVLFLGKKDDFNVDRKQETGNQPKKIDKKLNERVQMECALRVLHRLAQFCFHFYLFQIFVIKIFLSTL